MIPAQDALAIMQDPVKHGEIRKQLNPAFSRQGTLDVQPMFKLVDFLSCILKGVEWSLESEQALWFNSVAHFYPSLKSSLTRYHPVNTWTTSETSLPLYVQMDLSLSLTRFVA